MLTSVNSLFRHTLDVGHLAAFLFLLIGEQVKKTLNSHSRNQQGHSVSTGSERGFDLPNPLPNNPTPWASLTTVVVAICSYFHAVVLH